MQSIVNWARLMIAHRPPFRGRDFLLRHADRFFGSLDTKCRADITLPLFLSSGQDCAFLHKRPESNNLLVQEIENLPDEGCFVDIGANIGFYSALAAKKLGRNGTVISVEPSEREFWRLAKNRSLNPYTAKWLLFNAAIGDQPNAYVHLDTDVGHTGMNRVATDPETSSAERNTVLSLSLDRLVEISNLPMIDLVKVDVEGHEFSVLKGAEQLLNRHLIHRLVIEVTDKFLRLASSSKQELYDFMKSFGYSPHINSDDWQYDEIFTAPGISPKQL